MLTEQDAITAFKKAMPNREPQKVVTYNGLYLILAPDPGDALEGNMDPFFSVDLLTGAIQDYSIFRDGKAKEIMELFQKAPDL